MSSTLLLLAMQMAAFFSTTSAIPACIAGIDKSDPKALSSVDVDSDHHRNNAPEDNRHGPFKRMNSDKHVEEFFPSCSEYPAEPNDVTVIDVENPEEAFHRLVGLPSDAAVDFHCIVSAEQAQPYRDRMDTYKSTNAMSTTHTIRTFCEPAECRLYLYRVVIQARPCKPPRPKSNTEKKKSVRFTGPAQWVQRE